METKNKICTMCNVNRVNSSFAYAFLCYKCWYKLPFEITYTIPDYIPEKQHLKIFKIKN